MPVLLLLSTICIGPSARRGRGPQDDNSRTLNKISSEGQFWKTTKVVLPTPKEIVTMRLDADMLRWFRRERGYQTRINAILRAYMEAQESA